ncbi:MAG: M14 family zinc carboxypeptidase, partial [Caldilinea sp.]
MATLALIVVFLVAPTPAAAQDDSAAPLTPDGVVVRVSFIDQDDVQRLVVQYDVWHVDHTAKQATLWVTSADLLRLQAQSRQITIDHKATAELMTVQAAMQRATSAGGIPNFPCYRTVEETYASMTQLAQDFPTLVREVIVGESWQYQRSAGAEGYTIPGLVLTNQAIPHPKPVFFLMAAIHAREYTTAETALRFAEHLVRSYDIDADATWLLDYTEIRV